MRITVHVAPLASRADCTAAVPCDAGYLSPGASPSFNCCGYHVVLGRTSEAAAPDVTRAVVATVAAALVLLMVLPPTWRAWRYALYVPIRSRATQLLGQL